MIPILILIIFYMLILLNIKTQVCKKKKKSDYVSFSKFNPKNSQRQTLTWENV